ncbi:hypothetical protein ACTWP6_03180 [Mycobacterium sp. 4D054]|uniref:hypothetical protein n=1 Tax=Mycobacterium sp. 4D054 TaxID=3457440 RepID=UPI003FCEECF3
MEDLERHPVYKFAGKIYHDQILGTMIRIKYRTKNLRKRFEQDHRPTTILFHPDKPDYSQILYKISHSLGLTMTSRTATRPDVVVSFEDVTKRRHNPLLAELSNHHFVVNQHCNDISKTKVEQVFREVFGYGTFVDPRTYQGLCVMKSDDNAMHDGTLIECPTATTRTDVVYQRVINNTSRDQVVDIRVPIVGGSIPLVYWKFRDARTRFSNRNDRVKLGSPESAFSDRESVLIQLFAKNLGLDFGELDILRDVDDGQIYIVDVNNTPCGPPNHLGKAESKQAVKLLSASFNDEFVRRAPTRDV